MLPVISLGPLQLPVPPLALIVSLAVGFWLAERRTRVMGVPKAFVDDGLFWALVVGVVAARLLYVVQYPDAFLASPWSVLSPNPGLLDPLGGVVGAALFLWGWGQRRGLTLLRMLDGLTPFFAVLQVGIAFYHFARGSFFGMPTNLPWAVRFLGVDRHPTALYWVALALVVLAGVEMRLRRRPREAPDGWLFWPFLAWSVGVYIFVEGLRGDAQVLGNGLRVGHLVAIPLLAVALWQWEKLRRSPGPVATSPKT